MWGWAPGSGEEVWGPRPAGQDRMGAEPAASLLPPAGQFGAGTESYFSLLRFLLLLNVLASVLTACMVLLPTWLEGTPPGPPAPNASSPCGSYNPGSHGLVTFATELFNLLSGEVRAWVPGSSGPPDPGGPLPEPPCPAFPSSERGCGMPKDVLSPPQLLSRLPPRAHRWPVL